MANIIALSMMIYAKSRHAIKLSGRRKAAIVFHTQYVQWRMIVRAASWTALSITGHWPVGNRIYLDSDSELANINSNFDEPILRMHSFAFYVLLILYLLVQWRDIV